MGSKKRKKRVTSDGFLSLGDGYEDYLRELDPEGEGREEAYRRQVLLHDTADRLAEERIAEADRTGSEAVLTGIEVLRRAMNRPGGEDLVHEDLEAFLDEMEVSGDFFEK